MIEQGPISRRAFFKQMTNLAVGTAVVPKVSTPIELPSYHDSIQLSADELQNENGIKVIDNTGIRVLQSDDFGNIADDYKVDIMVDTTLLRENIRRRAKTMLSPDLIPIFEKKLNTLVISFGARPYDDVRKQFD